MARILFIGMLCILLSGCTWLPKLAKTETTNPGGFADSAADYIFVANNPRVRLFRAYVFTAAATRVAAGHSDKDPIFRERLAIHVRNTMGTLAAVADCVKVDDTSCYFDTQMRDYYGALYKLVKVIAPSSEIGELADVASVDPVSLAKKGGALWTLIKKSVKAGGTITAIYRDTLRLNTKVAIRSLPESSDQRLKLQALLMDESGSMEGWADEVRKVNLKPEPQDFQAVERLMTASCKKLAGLSYDDTHGIKTNKTYLGCNENSEKFIASVKKFKPMLAPAEPILTSSIAQ